MADFSTRSSTPDDWARALAVGPHYEPPYPGAVQDELAWHLVKVVREDARLRSEVEVEVPASAGWPGSGTGPAFFTLDLVVEVPVGEGAVRRVAFEAAGGHGPRALRDHDRRLRRDATLLANGAVDTIYRLRGSDLLGHMDDVLYLASQWDTDVFSERGRINLKTLASPQARALRLRPEQASVLLTYPLDLESEDLTEEGERHLWHAANDLDPFILVRRLDARFADVWAPYAEPGAETPATTHRFVPLRRAS